VQGTLPQVMPRTCAGLAQHPYEDKIADLVDSLLGLVIILYEINFHKKYKI
jgi:hypothetical protein